MPYVLHAVVAGGTKYGAAKLAADVALVTAGVSATSQYQQGKFSEEMAEYNAALAGQEAESVKEASEFEQRDLRKEGRQLRARQLLQFAKGGVVPTAGTPLLVGEETQADIEKDIRLQRYGYGLQYSRALSRGRMERQKGKYASRAGTWQAGTSLLTGAYRAASIYG